MQRPPPIAQSRRRPERSEHKLRCQRMQLSQKFPIKRNHHNVIDAFLIAQYLRQGLRITRLMLNHRHRAITANEFQRLNQCRHFGPRKLRLKPTSRIQCLNFRHRSLRNLDPVPPPFLPRIRRAIQDVIVNHHRHTLLAMMIIEFNQLRARIERELERRQCILGCHRRISTMPNQQGPLTFQQLFQLHAMPLARKTPAFKQKLAR